MNADLNADERRELGHKARAATLDALRELGGQASREEIRARALVDGGFEPRELSASAPEAVAGKYANQVEYRLSWALTNLKRDGLIENPRWSVWCLAGVALERPDAACEEAVAAARLSELQAMPYRDYLRSPEWRRTRAAALHRADYRCSLDVSHSQDLDVHHRTYDRRGAELASDLVVLCRPCHNLHHKEFGRPGRQRRKPAARPLASAGPPLSARLVAEARAQPRPSLLGRLFSR